MLPDPTPPLFSGGGDGSIGIGGEHGRGVQAGGADNDYRLDWDWTPDSGSPLLQD